MRTSTLVSGALARQSSFRLWPIISIGRGIIHQHGGMAVIAIMRTTLLDNSRKQHVWCRSPPGGGHVRPAKWPIPTGCVSISRSVRPRGSIR